MRQRKAGVAKSRLSWGICLEGLGFATYLMALPSVDVQARRPRSRHPYGLSQP